jgi:hypothetical protein
MANTWQAGSNTFDVDTSVALSALETAVSHTMVSGDKICVYNGATLTWDVSRPCLLAILGDKYTGAASAGQKYGIISIDAGVTITWDGNATNTNSGIKSSPTTPGAESTGCRLIINGTSASHVTFTNAGDSLSTGQRWTLNFPYGYCTISYLDANYHYGQLFIALHGSSTRGASNSVINNVVASPIGIASNQVILINVPIDQLLDYRFNTFDMGSLTNNLHIISYTGTSTRLVSGGAIDASGCIIKGTGDGQIGVFEIARTNSSIYCNDKIAFADIRPTQVVPTGLAFTDAVLDGELTWTITNIAAYANSDEIVIYNSADDSVLGRTSKTQYVADGNKGRISGLTNATTYTMYAKATSDNNTYSAATATAQGTPTAPVNTNPGEANVLDGVTWYLNSVLKTGTLSVVITTSISAVTVSAAGLLTITTTNAGASKGDGWVEFDGQEATVVTWSATLITAQLTRSVTAGTYALSIKPDSTTGYGTGGTRVTLTSDLVVTPSGYTGAVGYARQRILAGGFN